MRPSKDKNFIEIVQKIAERSECSRRHVGAVITDIRGRILSTGYNGMAPGQVPCTTSPCAGSKLESGQGLDVCEASHAEISALVTLEKPFEAHTIYCTTAPCISCTKALLLTTIQEIIFIEDYVVNGKALWIKDNRIWTRYYD